MALLHSNTFLSIAMMTLYLLVAVSTAEQKDFLGIHGLDGVQHYAADLKPDSVLKRTYEAAVGRVKRFSDDADFADIEAKLEELKRANEKDTMKIVKLGAAMHLLFVTAKGAQASTQEKVAAMEKGKQAETGGVGPASRSIEEVAASERRLNEIFSKVRDQLDQMRSVAMRSADPLEAQVTAFSSKVRLDELFRAVKVEINRLQTIQERSFKADRAAATAPGAQ